MTALDWRHARRGDRQSFQRFTCTTEGTRERSIASSDWMLIGVIEHERRVQSRIRDFKPPTASSCSMFVGMEAGAIAAAVHVTSGPTTSSIDMLAVSSTSQRQGLGREALEVALDELSLNSQDCGQPSLNVYVDIHADNIAARNLFASRGFARVAEHAEGYHRWVARIAL